MRHNVFPEEEEEDFNYKVLNDMCVALGYPMIGNWNVGRYGLSTADFVIHSGNRAPGILQPGRIVVLNKKCSVYYVTVVISSKHIIGGCNEF